MSRGMKHTFCCPGIDRSPHSAWYYAAGLCQSCYAAHYRHTHVVYFARYRSRLRYKTQRSRYDIAYQLKEPAGKTKT